VVSWSVSGQHLGSGQSRSTDSLTTTLAPSLAKRRAALRPMP
jgi:hypothetical protein